MHRSLSSSLLPNTHFIFFLPISSTCLHNIFPPPTLPLHSPFYPLFFLKVSSFQYNISVTHVFFLLPPVHTNCTFPERLPLFLFPSFLSPYTASPIYQLNHTEKRWIRPIESFLTCDTCPSRLLPFKTWSSTLTCREERWEINWVNTSLKSAKQGGIVGKRSEWIIWDTEIMTET